MDLICDQMGGAYENQVQLALSVFDTWALCYQTLTKITVVLFFCLFFVSMYLHLITGNVPVSYKDFPLPTQ